MNERLQYRVNSELKNEYDKFIIEKYGNKHSKCGSEISKWIKMGLAIEGNEKYQNDPDVQTMLKKTKKIFKENPKHASPSKSKDNTIEELIERKLDEKFAQFEKKTRREVSKKHGHAEFKKQFKMAFQDYHQVNKRELEQFIMNQADIVDKRAVQNRIQYLLSHGVLE